MIMKWRHPHDVQVAGERKVNHALEQVLKKVELVLTGPAYENIDELDLDKIKVMREELKGMLSKYKS